MPLEPTVHHDRSKPTSRRWLAIGLLGISIVLGGCAEGTRADAERGKEQDAERDSVLSDMQATETYNLVNNPGTPSPQAEAPQE